MIYGNSHATTIRSIRTIVVSTTGVSLGIATKLDHARVAARWESHLGWHNELIVAMQELREDGHDGYAVVEVRGR